MTEGGKPAGLIDGLTSPGFLRLVCELISTASQIKTSATVCEQIESRKAGGQIPQNSVVIFNKIMVLCRHSYIIYMAVSNLTLHLTLAFLCE